jgi:hypothetical protein
LPPSFARCARAAAFQLGDGKSMQEARFLGCAQLLVILLSGCSDGSKDSAAPSGMSGNSAAAGAQASAGTANGGSDPGVGGSAGATATGGLAGTLSLGGLGGMPVDAIANAGKDFDVSAMTEEEALTHLSGSYDVAIYFTPEDKKAELGKGTIELAFDGDIVKLTLKSGAGSTLAQAASSRTTPQDASVEFDQTARQLVVDQASSTEGGVHVSFLEAGGLIGYVGSTGTAESYRFRNNVVHYGPGLPPHLAAQIGTWSAANTSLLCEQAEVLVTVEDTGHVRMSGKASADCEDAEVTNDWDGQDDYVAPKIGAADGVEIVMDSYKGGGSQPGGGIFITVPADAKQAGIWLSKTVLDGARGNLEVAYPIKH